MSTLATFVQVLRRDRRRLLQVATPASILCILAGIVFLFVLPLQDYSRKTYISENALLPGQVHTYFEGSEHNIFRAYRHEVHTLTEKPREERVFSLQEIFKSSGLKVATQKYHYQSVATNASGENVYALLQGPRADATEAIVLIAAWKNMNDESNQSAVALVLTLARYFKRWSLWSKDIIFVIPEDSVAGPQAWVDAYHDSHDPKFVSPLTIKSGALQGAIAVDYPAGPWGHRFEKLHIIYDGINGQLPNLDLFNTAVSVSQGQMGVICTLQRMLEHGDRYKERVLTLVRGMLNQAIGHSTGPHSGFMRYHVDAITLQTVGDGWQDEMSLGRSIEGIFRSLNNLLEHLHQSFFFYLLMHSERFVSIGTYLPSAMCIAASYTIMAIALWFQTGFRKTADSASENASEHTGRKSGDEKDKISKNAIENSDSAPVERHMFFPILALTTAYFLGLVPLTLFNNLSPNTVGLAFKIFTVITLPFPIFLALAVPRIISRRPTEQELSLLHCFCCMILGMILAALATVNYSLAYAIGLLCSPIVLVRIPGESSLGSADQKEQIQKQSKSIVKLAGLGILSLILFALSPMTVLWVGSTFVSGGLEEVLREAAFGWWVYGLWTQVIVWLVYWPSWITSCYVLVAQLVEW